MLTIRRRKGGNWFIRGTVRVGDQVQVIKEQSTGFSDKSAADAYRIRLEKETQDALLFGTTRRTHNLTFADIGADYVTRAGGLHKMDIWRIGELNKVLGNMPLAEVPEGWRKFQSERCLDLAPATVERFRATLQAALNHAQANRGIAVPRLPKIRFQNERVRWLSKPIRDKLLSSYAQHVQPIILTLCFQGCRTQEALQLQWEHVSLDLRTMFFPRTKNGHPRTVKMHVRVFDAISELAEKRKHPTTGSVFLNRLGKPYADTRDYKLPGGNPLRQAHDTACTRAGVEDFTIHDWRHHWASWCVMSGIDLETIKRMGGWKTLRMLERYMAVSTEHMDAAVKKIS